MDTSASPVKERHVINPANSDHPVVYDLVVKNFEDDALKVYRHVLNFDPDSPGDIKLKLVETAKCTLDSGATLLSAQRQMPCDGRIATLWVPQDERSFRAPDAAYISVSPRMSNELLQEGRKAVKTKFEAARFYDGGDDIYDFGLCPVSGIAVGLKESSIQVYDFVGTTVCR